MQKMKESIIAWTETARHPEGDEFPDIFKDAVREAPDEKTLNWLISIAERYGLRVVRPK